MIIYSPTIQSVGSIKFVSQTILYLTKTSQPIIYASGLTIASATSITAGTFVTTSAAPGKRTLAARSPDGTVATLANCVSITAADPTLSAITPAAGTCNDSLAITNLAGTNLFPNAKVKLSQAGQSDIWATNVVWVSTTKLTCTFDLTNKATGLWDVTVYNSDYTLADNTQDGTHSGAWGKSATLSEGLTVNPVIDSIAPTSGSADDDALAITAINGHGFNASIAAKLTKTGQSDINLSGVTVDSSLKIHGTVDLTTAVCGLWNIVVTNTDGTTATLADAFTVHPTVSAITPATGQKGASVSITSITGKGFKTGMTAKIGTISLTGVTVDSITQLHGTVNLATATAGTQSVTVANTDGQASGTLATAFEVTPTVTSITSSRGTTGTSVSITNLAGDGFASGMTVKLKRTGESDISASGVTVFGLTHAHCAFNLAGAAVGSWDVEITIAGATATLSGGFTVTA